MASKPSQRPTRPRLAAVDAPIGVIRQEAVVLLVDADRVTRRMVELTFSKASTNALAFSVEAANDAAGAFDIMSNSLVDLVIAETSLSDMSGLSFIRKLKMERRLRDVPFAFLSADVRVETRVEAIGAGADAYLEKPCESTELVAYTRALVARRRASLEERGRRSYTLAGEFSALPFPDLVSILQLSRRRGVLSVVTPFAAGEVFFYDSEILHATYGSLQGKAAFYRLLSTEAGSFEFASRDIATYPQRTIDESVTSLIMEGARLLDEAQHRRTPTEPLAPLQVPVGAARVEPGRRAALVASQDLTLAFDRGVADPFVLGELRLFTRSELDAWNRDIGRDRLEMCLIADLSDGVSTLLSAAAQSTESLILSALGREPKVLGLSFHMRNERSLEVLLIDINDIGAAEHVMIGTPAVAIIAPPQGDFLAIGPKGAVELGHLLEHMQPAVVVGVGNAALPENLGSTPAIKRARLPLGCLRGVLGAAETDLRAVLATGVRLWGSTASAPVAPAKKERT
jgi:CheY-like chemotaxis protein